MTNQAPADIDEPKLTSQDEIMVKIADAVALHCGGDRAAAQRRFTELWEEIGPAGDPLHRCSLAHFMADVQADPEDALAWDLRALEAADALSDERAQHHHPSLTVRAFYPSLHLNLAEDYRKLKQLDRAREHLARADEAAKALGADEVDNGLWIAFSDFRERLAADSLSA